MKTMYVLRNLVALLMGLCLGFSPLAQAANPQVLMQTSEGDITLELFPDKAPQTVANFIMYVNDGFYNQTIFHRVIRGFMVQGGGYTTDMVKKATKPAIVNESNNGLNNLKYTIAMARTNDPNSATSQFFINQAENTFLDGSNNKAGYAVFGKVIKGTEVIEKIVQIPTRSTNFMNDVPAKPVIITSTTLIHSSDDTSTTKDM